MPTLYSRYKLSLREQKQLEEKTAADAAEAAELEAEAAEAAAEVAKAAEEAREAEELLEHGFLPLFRLDAAKAGNTRPTTKRRRQKARTKLKGAVRTVIAISQIKKMASEEQKCEQAFKRLGLDRFRAPSGYLDIEGVVERCLLQNSTLSELRNKRDMVDRKLELLKVRKE